MEIKRDQFQQLVVSHLGQQHFATAFEQILGELTLGVNELIDLFFNRPAADELVHEYVIFLSDSKGAVGCESRTEPIKSLSKQRSRTERQRTA